MRARRQYRHATSHEFDLDLAPLLSVMVKLVPVLLLSSAFVQVMMIESDLPQVVKEAMAENKNDQPKPAIQLKISNTSGYTLVVSYQGQQTSQTIPLKEGRLDHEALHLALRNAKGQHPEVFKLELAPEGTVLHAEIVRAMDEARRSRDKSIQFPVKTSGSDSTTDFMFPDVVFINSLEG